MADEEIYRSRKRWESVTIDPTTMGKVRDRFINLRDFEVRKVLADGQITLRRVK